MIETPGRIEPCFFEGSIPESLASLAIDFQVKAAELEGKLSRETAVEARELVRIMNCYYSNLIEGHNTKPKEIEEALHMAASQTAARPLLKEALAHIKVQKKIDQLFSAGKLPIPTSSEFVLWVHREFYEEMPEEFRFVERSDGSRVEVVPGKFRSSLEEDVEIGWHAPPSSGRVQVFMDHFSRRYASAEKQSINRIISVASAHHRFNYIHPFVDGNGRVSRLMSHAMALRAGVGGSGLWSISRGLARGLESNSEYKIMLNHADSPRRGDLDGRGNLSESALQEYCEWFLNVAIDQVTFSSYMFDLDGLEDRYRRLVDDVLGNKRACDLISAILKYGSLKRGDAHIVLRVSERTARNVLVELQESGFIKSDSPKTPVRVAFPLEHRHRFFPSLFSDVEVVPPSSPSFSF